jgi:hypothetical protein
LGAAAVGLLLSATAQAQIAVVDGSLTTGAQGAGASNSGSNLGSDFLSQSFMVSSSADVLVVNIYDRNQILQGAGIGTEPSSLSWGSQSINRVIAQNNDTSHYGDSDIFVLYNPTPGMQTITFTDSQTSGGGPTGVSGLAMQVYDLSGVDTTVAPVTFGVGNSDITGQALNLPVTTTMAGAWADVVVSSGDGASGFPTADTITSSSGTPSYQWVLANQSALFGGVQSMAAGASTLTFATANTTSPQVGFAAAVFEPLGSVPEPSSLALIGLGTLAFGFISRFRKNS